MLILASTSPYRRELLARLRVPFQAVAPETDEAPLALETPLERAQRLALAKAAAVSRKWRDATVIGSDQVAAKRDGVEELAVGVARALHPAIDSRCSIGAPDGWE